MIWSFSVSLQRLREEVRQLKQSMELVTNTTPENLVERILTYARPLSEFKKYEVPQGAHTICLCSR